MAYSAPYRTVWLFVNGEQVTKKSLSTATALDPSGTSFIGGFDSEDRFFHGKVKQFELFNRPLSPENIQNDSIAGLYRLLAFHATDFSDKLQEDTISHEGIVIIERDEKMPELPIRE